MYLSDVNITINSTKDFDNAWNDRNIRRKLKLAYKRLPGKANVNSMVLYSGPEGPHQYTYLATFIDHRLRAFAAHNIVRLFIFAFLKAMWSAFPSLYKCMYMSFMPLIVLKPGCLYLGDYEAKGRNKFIQMDDSYKAFWKHIGIVQVPHHGSWHNYNPKIIKHSMMLLVISAGRWNKYGHPHRQTLFSIIRAGGIPLLVNEKPSTRIILEFHGIWLINGLDRESPFKSKLWSIIH